MNDPAFAILVAFTVLAVLWLIGGVIWLAYMATFRTKDLIDLSDAQARANRSVAELKKIEAEKERRKAAQRKAALGAGVKLAGDVLAKLKN